MIEFPYSRALLALLHGLALVATFWLLLASSVTPVSAVAFLIVIETESRVIVRTAGWVVPPPRWASVTSGAACGALVFLLVVVPLHDLAVYSWSARPPWSPLVMVDSRWTVGVLCVGVAWTVLVRARELGAPFASHRVASRFAVLGAAVVWAGLWWLASLSLGETNERDLTALLAVSMPSVIPELLRTVAGAWQEKHASPDRRSAPRSRSQVARVPLGATLLLGLSCAMLAWHALRLFGDRAAVVTDLAQRRAREHAALAYETHDACLALEYLGDASSVPLIIWSLRFHDGHERHEHHCDDALELLTHQQVGGTWEEWREWFAHNGHKSWVEWIRDGFVASGLEAVRAETPAAVRQLLAFRGGGQAYRKRLNAQRLLESYDREMVWEQIREVSRDGAPEEKRGALWAGLSLDAARLEPLLPTLVHDSSRMVRVAARQVEAERGIQAITNPSGSLLRTFPLGSSPIGRGVTSSDGGLFFSGARDGFFRVDLALGGERWTTELQDGRYACLDGDDVLVGTSGGQLHRLRARDGQRVWSFEPPSDPPRMVPRLAHLACLDDVVLLAAEHPDWVTVVSKVDGEELATAPGRLLTARAGVAVLSEGLEVRVRSLPDLLPSALFRVGYEVVAAAVGPDTVVLMPTQARPNQDPRDGGPTWLEGWSLERGQRLWGPLTISEDHLEDDHSLIQAGEDVAYVSLGGLTTKLQLSTGEILWEASPGGQIFEVGERVVVLSEDRRDLVVFDADSGRRLARYALEGVAYHTDVFVVGGELVAVDMDDVVHVFRMP